MSDQPTSNTEEATKNILLSLLGTASVPLAFTQPWLVGTFLLAGGLVSSATAVRRQIKYSITPKDYTDALSDLVNDSLETFTLTKESKPVTNVEQILIDVLPDPVINYLETEQAKSTDSFYKLMGEVIEGSIIIAGARGAGKSTWLTWVVSQIYKNDPNCDLKIGDPHFNPKKSNWLPGISVEDFEKYFLVEESPDKPPYNAIFNHLKEIFEEGKHRYTLMRQGKFDLKDFKRIWFVIDEYFEVVDELGDDIKMEMARIIQQIQNRFRKVGIDVILGLHTLKKTGKEGIGIDDAAINQMTLICLPGILKSATMKFPKNWNVNELAQKQAELGKFTAVIGKLDGNPVVIKPPNLYEETLEMQFVLPEKPEEDTWLENHRDEIVTLAKDGKSATAIAKKLSIQRHANNPKFIAVKELVAEHKPRLNIETIPLTGLM